jgi:hypothetical protein
MHKLTLYLVTILLVVTSSAAPPPQAKSLSSFIVQNTALLAEEGYTVDRVLELLSAMQRNQEGALQALLDSAAKAASAA